MRFRYPPMCALPRLCLLLSLTVFVSRGATLEQMSLDELIRQSTSVVLGQVGSQRTVQEGALIYTLHRLKVLKHWKGQLFAETEIALPGGSIGSLSQRFSGVPHLETGSEFVVFLWRGPSGRTQITGLSQGLFALHRGADGRVILRREPGTDVVLAPGSGARVQNPAVEMPLDELVSRIYRVLGAGEAPAP